MDFQTGRQHQTPRGLSSVQSKESEEQSKSKQTTHNFRREKFKGPTVLRTDTNHGLTVCGFRRVPPGFIRTASPRARARPRETSLSPPGTAVLASPLPSHVRPHNRRCGVPSLASLVRPRLALHLLPLLLQASVSADTLHLGGSLNSAIVPAMASQRHMGGPGRLCSLLEARPSLVGTLSPVLYADKKPLRCPKEAEAFAPHEGAGKLR